MKKILVLLLTASMIAAAFMGCTGPAFGSSSADTNENGLRDDVELEILEYGFGKNVNPDDYIIEYYGTYNDATVVKITEKKAISPGDGMYSETVAGFEFPDGKRLRVWYIDKLYKLQEAYESGILTVDDIESIYAKRSNK